MQDVVSNRAAGEQAQPAGAASAQPQPAAADGQQAAGQGTPQAPGIDLAAISELIANNDASALQQMAQNGEIPFRDGPNSQQAPAEQPPQPAPQPAVQSPSPGSVFNASLWSNFRVCLSSAFHHFYGNCDASLCIATAVKVFECSCQCKNRTSQPFSLTSSAACEGSDQLKVLD